MSPTPYSPLTVALICFSLLSTLAALILGAAWLKISPGGLFAYLLLIAVAVALAFLFGGLLWLARALVLGWLKVKQK